MHVKAFGLRREKWKATAIAIILHFSHHLTGVSEEINVEHGSRAPFRACLCFRVPCVVLWLHYHNLIIVFSQPFGALLQSLAKAIEVSSKYNRNVVIEDRQWLNVVNVIVREMERETITNKMIQKLDRKPFTLPHDIHSSMERKGCFRIISWVIFASQLQWCNGDWSFQSLKNEHKTIIKSIIKVVPMSHALDSKSNHRFVTWTV